jgi:hypothetical protein
VAAGKNALVLASGLWIQLTGHRPPKWPV